jgi:hypothetical protein
VQAEKLARTASGEAAAPRELKAALLEAVSKANNALEPSDLPCLQGAVEQLAAQLAAANPTPDPASSPLISGRQVAGTGGGVVLSGSLALA